MKLKIFILAFLLLCSCKEEKKVPVPSTVDAPGNITHAKGFTLEKQASGISILKITSPWPGAESAFTYALIPKELAPKITLDAGTYDAIVTVPVQRIIVTSTTHIPALESLGVLDKLVGFPNTSLVSSKAARQRIDSLQIMELGNNEQLNIELVMELHPDVVVGFGINSANKAYETIQRSNIPVVYNGEWTEETPLGKAEWIKFFAPFFNLETKADRIFSNIENNYAAAQELAKKAKNKPTVLTGGLYKDVWHVAGGKSWMSRFLNDAQTSYLWADNGDTGGLALSLEQVLEKGHDADFWLNPSMLTSYSEMKDANGHYTAFDAFKNKTIYTNTIAKGATGGLLYYELGPNRPDLVLKDLIHIFHPSLLPDHRLFFFKPFN